MIEHSVVFRTGPLTERDYDEAIEYLQEAKVAGIGYCPCGDTGHSAEYCHHNPLVQARRGASKMHEYRCYHCGDVFVSGEAADEHFGPITKTYPCCVTGGGPAPAGEHYHGEPHPRKLDLVNGPHDEGVIFDVDDEPQPQAPEEKL